MARTVELVVQNKVGLHARPAAAFVKTAARFASTVRLTNISKESAQVNAKSILAVLSAGVQMNDRISITAEGADEEATIQALAGLIAANFGEADSA